MWLRPSCSTTVGAMLPVSRALSYTWKSNVFASFILLLSTIVVGGLEGYNCRRSNSTWIHRGLAHIGCTTVRLRARPDNELDTVSIMWDAANITVWKSISLMFLLYNSTPERAATLGDRVLIFLLLWEDSVWHHTRWKREDTAHHWICVHVQMHVACKTGDRLPLMLCGHT